MTVCMNRREHLLATAPQVAASGWHDEHLIVDWSSTPPLRREDLPADRRLRLLRVEGEPRWNLCRAYNFALARARGALLLKLDADCWPTAAFDPRDPALTVPALPPSAGGRLCAFGSGPEGRKGQFLIGRALFEEVGGFNEHLVGYGFDDKDLRARLRLHLGRDPAVLPPEWVGVIPHSDEERAERSAAGGRWLRASQGFAAMRASRQANRLLAALCPWGARSTPSRYDEEAPGRWRVRRDSLPRPPAPVADEVEHERRMTFWSHFLAIPPVFLESLPFSLAPPPREGRWPVRWWHRLWWHTGRRLLQAPVVLLAAARDVLQGGAAP
ncbi:MAG: glycosyltransferase family A protein [Synechococcaceae cyanobacterium]|nr:glycosyltransferase family A protein [Synechococcaceae cyanobacterium]